MCYSTWLRSWYSIWVPEKCILEHFQMEYGCFTRVWGVGLISLWAIDLVYKNYFPQVSTNLWWQVWPKRLSNFSEHSFSMPQCTPSCFHSNRFHASVAAENLSTRHLKHIICDSQWDDIFHMNVSYEICPCISCVIPRSFFWAMDSMQGSRHVSWKPWTPLIRFHPGWGLLLSWSWRWTWRQRGSVSGRGLCGLLAYIGEAKDGTPTRSGWVLLVVQLMSVGDSQNPAVLGGTRCCRR